MLISVVTLPGFNEIDSFVALNILGRVRKEGWTVRIAAPTQRVTSMNGVTIERNMTMEEMAGADAVILGSGIRTQELVGDSELMRTIRVDPGRQLIAAQCSGALLLARLGFLAGMPACTDLATTPALRDAGVTVLDQPFFATANIATAGGCLASQYLAGWIIARLDGLESAREALHYVAPVGEKEDYVSRAIFHITRC